MLERVRRGLHPLWRRQPRLRSLALDAIDVAVRPLLLPFRLGRPVSDARHDAAVERQTDDYNRAARQYFDVSDAAHLEDKPFSEPAALSRRLIDVGILLDALRLAPGDTVLDVGAGTCWLSHFLNRYGCRTVALDVSDKALAIGRSIFARDPRTRWDLRPAFTVYDGRTLPLADGTIDRIVLYDAYHHLPNPRRLLQEFRRVLTGDGIVAMSEPGRGHAASDSSRAESAGGVLENELALEDIAEQALAAGFTAARVVVAPRRPPVEVDVRDLRRFMGGRGFARYWKSLCAELDGHHYLLLTAGDPAVTTRRPKYLNAVITSDETRSGLDLESLSARRVTFDVYNAGDTVWLNGEGEPGWTRFGAHLYKAGASRERVDYDWLRAPLASSVRPEESIRVAVDLPAIPTPGDYEIVFDLVVEGMAWFGERGSVPLAIQATVR